MRREEKTMKKQTMFLGMVLLLSSISAIALYSGESYTIELSEPYEYYSIVGNYTPIELTVVSSGNNVTISIGEYNSFDTFEMIFFNREKETIVQYVPSGGGGGGSSTTKYVDRNITEWRERNITAYIDKPAEIVYEEKEVIVEKVPSILCGLLLFYFIVIVGFIIYLVKGEKE